jgi:hypothetical protein
MQSDNFVNMPNPHILYVEEITPCWQCQRAAFVFLSTAVTTDTSQLSLSTKTCGSRNTQQCLKLTCSKSVWFVRCGLSRLRIFSSTSKCPLVKFHSLWQRGDVEYLNLVLGPVSEYLFQQFVHELQWRPPARECRCSLHCLRFEKTVTKL